VSGQGNVVLGQLLVETAWLVTTLKRPVVESIWNTVMSPQAVTELPSAAWQARLEG